MTGRSADPAGGWSLHTRIAIGAIGGALLGLMAHWRAAREGLTPLPLGGQVGVLATIGAVAGAAFHAMRRSKKAGRGWYYITWTISCAVGAAAFASVAALVDGTFDLMLALILVFLGGSIGLALAAFFHWLDESS